MAVLDHEEEKGRGPSALVQFVLLVVLTSAAIGMGWLVGAQLDGETPEAPSGPAEIERGTIGGGSGDDEAAEQGETLAAPHVHLLDPITTNLAEPSDTWVRLELALVFEVEVEPRLVSAIHQDLFAYMRTVKLRQVESASSFQHLKTDFKERANIRSAGRVSDVLVKALIYE